MTPAASKDAHEEGPVMRAAPVADQFATKTPGGPAQDTSEAPGGAVPGTADLDSVDLSVLQAVMSQCEPMTQGRLAKITGLPPSQLCIILEALRELRLLRRLNTVVPSYTAGRQ